MTSISYSTRVTTPIQIITISYGLITTTCLSFVQQVRHRVRTPCPAIIIQRTAAAPAPEEGSSGANFMFHLNASISNREGKCLYSITPSCFYRVFIRQKAAKALHLWSRYHGRIMEQKNRPPELMAAVAFLIKERLHRKAIREKKF